MSTVWLFLCYSLGFDLLLLIFLLEYVSLSTSSGLINLPIVSDLIVNMPVTTRSQKRLSTRSSEHLSTAISTGTRVLSTTCLTGTRVLSESSSHHHSITSTDTASDSSIFSDMLPNSSLTSDPPVHHDSSITVVSSFQNLKLENFEKSAFHFKFFFVQFTFTFLTIFNYGVGLWG